MTTSDASAAAELAAPVTVPVTPGHRGDRRRGLDAPLGAARTDHHALPRPGEPIRQSFTLIACSAQNAHHEVRHVGQRNRVERHGSHPRKGSTDLPSEVAPSVEWSSRQPVSEWMRSGRPRSARASPTCTLRVSGSAQPPRSASPGVESTSSASRAPPSTYRSTWSNRSVPPSRATTPSRCWSRRPGRRSSATRLGRRGGR